MMFGWLKIWFEELRIFCNFFSYEAERWRAHQEVADNLFPVDLLKHRLKTIESKICMDAGTLYDKKLSTLEDDAEKVRQELKKNQATLRLFERSFSEEVDCQLEKKRIAIKKKEHLISKIREENQFLQTAYGEKGDAYSRLNDAQEDIESWYDKSEGKNRGRKLPRRAIFGQSFGDLNSYKNDRDDAVNDIEEAKTKIEKIKEKKEAIKEQAAKIDEIINEINYEIEEIRRDQIKFIDLQKEGITKKSLKDIVASLKNSVENFDGEISLIEKSKKLFISRETLSSGVDELRTQIRDCQDKRKTFLSEFYTDSSRRTRRIEHRKIWLQKKKR